MLLFAYAGGSVLNLERHRSPGREQDDPNDRVLAEGVLDERPNLGPVEATQAVAWGPDSLAPRAVAEADGEGFAELLDGLRPRRVARLGRRDRHLRGLAGGGLKGGEDEHCYALQLLAALGPCSSTTRPRGTSSRRASRERRVSASTERAGSTCIAQRWQRSRPLHRPPTSMGGQRAACDRAIWSWFSCEEPRVRVVLDVCQGSDGGKVVILAPDALDGAVLPRLPRRNPGVGSACEQRGRRELNEGPHIRLDGPGAFI